MDGGSLHYTGGIYMKIYRNVYLYYFSQRKKYKKAKWLSEEALQIVEKEEKQKTKEKGKDIPN